ncbi:hypothetical protein C8J57DRAFT_38664 [Mycena rebaudengoi]|nr:hypothetical protein C8J57DRAFT_38664 [Mycena rebaudengoi]
MFANNNASRSFTSLTSDEVRWLSASKAFSDGDGDSANSSTDLVKSQSVALPKSSRPRYDTRRRSILLDDFLGSNTLNRSADASRARFGTPSTPTDTPPPSPVKRLPSTPPRAPPYSIDPFGQDPAVLDEIGALPPLPQRPTEWIYRRPKSPSSLSRSPSTLSASPSSVSRSPSSSRSATPTPSRIRPPTGYRPRTPTPTVAEMNQSPFWSTVVPPQRTASVRTGSPHSHGTRTPSRSSPNLLDFRASPRSQKLGARPPHLPIQRERSGSASSSISTTSTSSLPRTPPSPSLYSQNSFSHPPPDTRSTTPTKSILTLTPKRSPSISTKHSSGSKSVKFDEVPAIRYASDRELHLGDGRVRGEEWNSYVLDGEINCMDKMDLLQERETQTPTPLGKSHSGALKRLLTLRTRTKNKPRLEISGPYALAASSPGLPAQHPERAASDLSLGSPPASPLKSKSASSSFIVQGQVGVIPSSPNGGTDTGFPVKYKSQKVVLAYWVGGPWRPTRPRPFSFKQVLLIPDEVQSRFCFEPRKRRCPVNRSGAACAALHGELQERPQHPERAQLWPIQELARKDRHRCRRIILFFFVCFRLQRFLVIFLDYR